MRTRSTRTRRRLSLLFVLALAMSLAGLQGAVADHNGLHVTALTDADLDAEDLAELLVAPGNDGADVEIVPGSVSFTGAPAAAGAFSGGEGIIGFDAGIILGSGQVVDVVGPNESSSTTTAFGTPGDPDLTALAGVSTFDAAILEFEFTVPEGAEQVFFSYVFGSEEYNEFVSPPLTGVNDTFAFWVNGVNCATVPNPDDPDEPFPVSITTVNNGQPNVEPVNPHLYINNDPFSPDATGETVPAADLLDTEMDGLTVVLGCEAEIEAGETNTMRMGIADGGDSILDSWVLIQAGSLSIEPPEPPDPDPPVEGECVDLIAAQTIVAGEVCVTNDGANLSVTYTATGGWMLTQTHLAVSTDEPGGGDWTDNANRWQNRQGNPAPGRFPHSAHHDPSVSTVTYTIPLEDLGADEGDLLFVAAHAIVQLGDGEDATTESAWGQGDLFVERGNWAMFFTYTVQ